MSAAALPQAIRTFIDRDLPSLSSVWAAAGMPRTVFSLTPSEPVALTGGEAADVAA